jgi:hypothetical protein
VTPESIHSVTPDLSVSGPLRKPDSPALPATSFTAWPEGQLSMADCRRPASGCELPALPSAASIEPLLGVSVAASVAQTAEAAGSEGSPTVPHCVLTVAPELELLPDELEELELLEEPELLLDEPELLLEELELELVPEELPEELEEELDEELDEEPEEELALPLEPEPELELELPDGPVLPELPEEELPDELPDELELLLELELPPDEPELDVGTSLSPTELPELPQPAISRTDKAVPAREGKWRSSTWSLVSVCP